MAAHREWGDKLSFPTEVHAKLQLIRRTLPLFRSCLSHLPNFTGISNPGDVAVVRFTIQVLPLKLQRISSNTALDDDMLSRLTGVLNAILRSLERLVRMSILDSHHIDTSASQWQNQYPRLLRLASLTYSRANMDNSCHIAELYLGYEDLGTEVLESLSSEMMAAMGALDYVLSCLAEDDRTPQSHMDSVACFTEEEITFITNASKLGESSSLLFSLLADRAACEMEHSVKLHLSDFSDLKFIFELEISTSCSESSSTRAKMTRFFEADAKHGEELSSLDQTCICKKSPRNEVGSLQCLSLAFNAQTIWHESSCSSLNNVASLFDDQPVSNAKNILDVKRSFAMRLSEQRVMEITLANSLLHLNRNHCLQRSWTNDKIFLTRLQEAPTNKWVPHILGHLESAHDENDADDFEDVLSFGLLLMQVESGGQMLPTADSDWEDHIPSTSLSLSNALKLWSGDIEIPYRQIGLNCLNFHQRINELSTPGLPESFKRTAAIYRYIFKPLREIIVGRHEEAIGFPSRAPALAPAVLLKEPPLYAPTKVDLFDDQGPTYASSRNIASATKVLRELESLAAIIQDRKNIREKIPRYAFWRLKTVRIAILDTGIDFEDTLIDECRTANRIRSWRGFVDDPDDVADGHGHGTHIARLILRLAPGAEICIAKISNRSKMDSCHLSRISEAIDWAIHEDVDMISMSFGIHSKSVETKEIRDAIWAAADKHIACFAAASNEGGNNSRAFPADMPNVICIHASDGEGNPASFNPNPKRNICNFASLGVSIPSSFRGNDEHKSGTSFATPVAVALAANILEFGRYWCDHDEPESDRLWSWNGITQAFQSLSVERQEFDYLLPTGNLTVDFEARFSMAIREVVGR